MRILQWVKLDICTKFFRSLSQQLPVKCFFLVFLWTFMSCHFLLNFTKQKIITVKITTKKFSFAFERSLTTIKNIKKSKKSKIWEKTQCLKISKKVSFYTKVQFCVHFSNNQFTQRRQVSMQDFNKILKIFIRWK